MKFSVRSKQTSTIAPTKEQSQFHPINNQHNGKEEGLKNHTTTTAPTLLDPLPSRKSSTRTQQHIRSLSKTERNRNAQGTQPSRSIPANGKAARPGLQRNRTTARTRYIDMLLGLDAVSPLHNILASVFVWILLAGYIVFPATFTKLQGEKIAAKADTNLKAAALRTVRNIPLLYIAAFACSVGILGCLWLWYRHRKNYIWVINRIFLPALLNSLAGLISTIVNVYSAQDGQYSVTAMVTIVVTSACSVVAAALFLLYNTVMLKVVKRRHEREVGAVEREEARWDGDGEGA